MAFRLRLFSDVTDSPVCHDSREVMEDEEWEAMLTPFGKGNNFELNSATEADTPLSIEIPGRPLIKRRTANEVRKSLFSGKRLPECEDNDDVSLKKRRTLPEMSHAADDQCDNAESIIAAVEKLESRGIIADGSRDYSLPTIPGKHGDLKSISPEVMADVIRGRYSDHFADVTIVDCRYPYEFEGGHIRSATNMYTKDEVYSLLQRPVTSSKPHVLIFHCEFSSERGPKMYRFLRSQDRELNKDQYPKLNFPEVYLLDGGYKAFYSIHKDLCDPISYKPMLHEDHAADLRHFRVKSKSFTVGDKQVSSRRHRSRLSRHLSF